MIQSIIADYRYEKSFTKLNNQLNKSIKDDLSETGTFWILCKNSFNSFSPFQFNITTATFFINTANLMKYHAAYEELSN